MSDFKVGERVSGVLCSYSIADERQRVTGTFTGRESVGYMGVEVVGRGHLYVHPSSLRHEPAEEQKAWVPSVGDRVLVGPNAKCHVDWLGVTGTVIPTGDNHGVKVGQVLVKMDKFDRSLPWLPSELRPLPASTQVGHRWSLTQDVCDACGRTGLEIRQQKRLACEQKPSEPVRGDPYLAHREMLSRQFYGVDGADTCHVTALKQADNDAERLSEMSLRDRRKSEALRMMDRECGPKYPYVETSGVFSTAQWEDG
jgi:hypothetical protein